MGLSKLHSGTIFPRCYTVRTSRAGRPRHIDSRGGCRYMSLYAAYFFNRD